MKRNATARGTYVHILLRLPRSVVLKLNRYAKTHHTPRAVVLRAIIEDGVDKFRRREKLQKKPKGAVGGTAWKTSMGARRDS